MAKSIYDEDARGTTLKLDEIKTTADTAKQNLATYQNTVDRKLEELTSSTQTLDGKINTASSKVDTVAGQIRTEISEVEGKIPTSIGGRNLFKGSREFSGVWYNAGNGSFFEEYKDVHIHRTKTAWLGKSQRISVKSGEIYTFSFYAKSDSENDEIMFYLSHSGTGTPAQGHPVNKYIAISTDYHRYSITIKITSDGIIIPRLERTNTTSYLFFGGFKLETGSISTDWSPAPEDLIDELSVVKTTITNTARGVEQLSNEVSNVGGKITTAEAEIRNLVDEVSSKVSQTDYNTLTGRVDSAETAISQHADEISKRLTKTQVEQAITDKGYATVTVLENKVRETADSFGRTITETRALIPNNMSNRNLALGTSDSWSTYVSTNSARSNWRVEICRIDFNYYKASVGKKLNLFVHISADNVTLDSSSSHKIAIQAYVLKKDGSVLWHNDNPFHRQWVRDLKSGNNYHIVKLSKEVKPSIYEEGARLVVECRIDGANHVDFHHRGVMVTASDIFPDAWSPAPEDVATVTALHDVKDTVSSHTRTIGAIGETGSILDNVSKVTQTANGLVQEVTGEGGLKTQVSTLVGSYAIKNLTSSGKVLNQLNLNKDGSVKIDGSLVQITGKTYIENGVISAAKIGDLDAGKIKTGTLDAARIKANSIDGSKIVFDDAFFNGLTASEANLQTLFAKDAFITQVQAVTLSASQITGGILEATNGAMKMDLNNANITFNQNATINFNSANNALVRRKGTHTAFVHFNDVNSSSDSGVGSLYASIGVTSSGDGINSESSGRFAGLRAFRGARGLAHDATLDQLELYGDRVLLMDDFGLNRGFIFRPSALTLDDFIDMNKLVTCVRALRDMWAHYKNSNGTLSDLLNNRSNSSVNASWENMHGFR
ncbi:TPA: gp58-like family protein [Streptococcus suis]